MNMQGVLPGQGFDCLLGEVSTLKLSPATTLPVPGTCCLQGLCGDTGTEWMGSQMRLWALDVGQDAMGTPGQWQVSASPMLGDALGGFALWVCKSKGWLW